MPFIYRKALERAGLRAATIIVVVTATSFTASVYLARAEPGPGQATTASLAFAGTLRKDGVGMTSPQTLTFRFRKSGTEVCATQVDSGPIDPASGSFQAAIPLAGCPEDLLDGTDVQFDVEVGSTVVLKDSPVAAVPYAKYADQVGYPDCPVGYTRAQDSGYIVCKKGPAGQEDEIVKVGQGPSAFWIDRYEAVVVSRTDGAEVTVPVNFEGFPRNGEWIGTKPPVHARSFRGRAPATNITWFQANQACRVDGKRLPTGDEWLFAARGTPDPGASNGEGIGKCNTQSDGPRATGIADPIPNVSCVSACGAEDMIGNVWEWTADWYAAPIIADPNSGGTDSRWPGPYNDDRLDAIASWGYLPPGDGTGWMPGLPVSAIRGGAWVSGTSAGTFSLGVSLSPAAWEGRLGFRCVTPR